MILDKLHLQVVANNGLNILVFGPRRDVWRLSRLRGGCNVDRLGDDGALSWCLRRLVFCCLCLIIGGKHLWNGGEGFLQVWKMRLLGTWLWRE